MLPNRAKVLILRATSTYKPESFPLFTVDDVDRLIGFLRPRVTNGDDGEIVRTIEQSRYKASRKLLEHVDAVVKGNSQYVLLDEQMVVYDRVLQAATDGIADKKKSVIIVKGGCPSCKAKSLP